MNAKKINANDYAKLSRIVNHPNYPIYGLAHDPVSIQFSDRIGQLRDNTILPEGKDWLDLLLEFKKIGEVNDNGIIFAHYAGPNTKGMLKIHLDNLLFTYGADVFNKYLLDVYGIGSMKKSA